MPVFIFKAHDNGGVESNRVDYIPLTRKLISILNSYTLSHVDTVYLYAVFGCKINFDFI